MGRLAHRTEEMTVEGRMVQAVRVRHALFVLPYTIYIIIRKKRSEKVYGKEKLDEGNRKMV